MSAEPVRSGTGASAELFFEDLTPGRWFDLGVVTVDGDEMVAFARRFDPQWYHVDDELARQSHHGGLIASGFYTVSLFMRAYVDHVLSRAAADASPGLEELRWLAPVRAGDRLAVRLDVMGSKPSTARPGLGTVTLTGTMLRLDAEGSPECEVLRTRFRGWFTLRTVEEEPDEATGEAVDVAEPLPDRPAPALPAQPAPALPTRPAPVSGPPVFGGVPVSAPPAGLPAPLGAPISGPPAPLGAPVSAPPVGPHAPLGAPVSAPPVGPHAPLGAPVSGPPLPVGSAMPVGVPVSAPPVRPAGPAVGPVSSLDAPTTVLPGPVVSAPPAQTPGPYGTDTPTAVIPAARDPHDPRGPHDHFDPLHRHHPPETT
ncbi:Acyl dehydratase [Micromonospora pallida]|uniref:Acyl dehydratase n=1 Tax=Micromonospora pallida TaxID=145854 RepID=A0A1C6T2H7_9ACTN|nr:MaoC/PaaZ C-terminal domain-containing protein [Micromonospora pallida]SCL35978.1 Acyl dehydratase [Micromonospora pallida]